ncbi:MULTISPECIES: glucosylglycerol-phosphate synthase [unclassified Chelatococcus]|uniref:glucosylglycerol-phosphate synthase n=1 Tax=unclassified Chelatococcus TaxID=2638111 RepID=UPI001BD129A8|nr:MULTISPECIES: glucosylglycerol-phosphate synthase [unclassified Chelatococcus]MBS7701201.1 glucosylglycerol-phosphate synthase [Chelatococcus sp. YT9]MBX3557332.1 glucosylglycerol-phosphate synthase [Chelatococcus sp.]
MKKSNLVIVYHRQPYNEVFENGKTIYREHASPNGIVPTLKSFFSAVDYASWIAWKQIDPSRKKIFDRVVEISDSYGTYTVSRLPLTAQQVKSFYHVTSKEALWPILHSFPEKYNYDPVDWATFREVNQLFAEAAVTEAAEGATVWVHDYNLWLVPLYVRQMRPDLRIAFFHHTPFPAPSMFNILPWREEIVDSLLACDLVGFHIPRYAASFVATARSLKDVEILEETPVEESLTPRGVALSEPVVPTRLRHGDREIRIDAFPVGANASYIRELCRREVTRQREAAIRNDLDGKRFIISIGRTDYTKGTRDMLLAFERLLERRPELQGSLQLLVTSVSSNPGMSVYRNVQREIEQIAGRINGRFATLSWQPLLLFTRALPFEELVAYYRCADVCWITPLRDGLNLVAKEYVAARRGMGGALVLSEFTGAAVELSSAVLTNPYSTRAMDAAIDAALDMPKDEQLLRMDAMWKSVEKYDSAHWARHIVSRFELPCRANDTRCVAAE